jgi:hypothetical protein
VTEIFEGYTYVFDGELSLAFSVACFDYLTVDSLAEDAKQLELCLEWFPGGI